ncbi:MAG: hypothetical protein KAI66_07985 [Lentisphaeria bacterium]|nr:hypothetical protein [Lentisphaeria bacterium]
MQAGFFKTDITPTHFPIRTYMREATEVLDPLHARAAAFRQGETLFAMVALDVVIVEAHIVARIREQAARRCPIPAENILVSGTHNHACPAVIERPSFKREDAYIEFMIERAADAVVGACEALREARLTAASGFETQASFNRRFVTRDDCVVTQPGGETLKRVLCNENVIDPEVGVLRVTMPDGAMMGLIVNFGCHACHFLGHLSAGYPGVLCDQLRNRFGADCGVVFLNGPCANVLHRDYLNPKFEDTKERTGRILADRVEKIVADMPAAGTGEDVLSVASRQIRIPYRNFEEEERRFEDPDVRDNVFQGLIGIGWYDYAALKEMSRQNDGGEDVEIQVFRIGEAVFAAIPAEYFMEHGLRIKRKSAFAHTYVVSLANGWIGYVPTQEAFQRKGGHETTAALWSKMCHEAGDRMADTALELMREL